MGTAPAKQRVTKVSQLKASLATDLLLGLGNAQHMSAVEYLVQVGELAAKRKKNEVKRKKNKAKRNERGEEGSEQGEEGRERGEEGRARGEKDQEYKEHSGGQTRPRKCKARRRTRLVVEFQRLTFYCYSRSLCQPHTPLQVRAGQFELGWEICAIR